MSEAWLDRGHGSKPSHLDVIFTSASSSRSPRRSELGDSLVPASGRTASRPTRPLVVAVVWVGVVLGTSGAAWAVRDALFPTIGPAEVSVWQNPGHDAKPSSDDEGDDGTTSSLPAPAVATTPSATTPNPADTDDGGQQSPGPATSLPDDRDQSGQGGPSVSVETPATPSSVDDHGGGSGSGSGGGSGSHGGSGSGSGGSGSGGSGGSGGGSGGGSDG